jgi:hypothetical protein
MAVRRIAGLSTELAATPLGAGYSGPATYRAAADITAADGSFAAGIWAYDGDLRSGNAGESHQIWVVLSGRVEISIAGELVVGERGDAIVFEAPYPAKDLRATDDFRAIWVSIPPRE